MLILNKNIIKYQSDLQEIVKLFDNENNVKIIVNAKNDEKCKVEISIDDKFTKEFE